MDYDIPNFPAVLFWAAPVFTLLIASEWYLVSRKKISGTYVVKDAITSSTMGVGQLISDILMGGISIGILMWIWQFRFFDWGFSVTTILICLVLQDFVYWYKHMAAHKVRWFWSAHNVHHSSEEYNLSTALRQPWNNHITGYVLLSSPLILLGFHPFLVAFIGAINLVYQFWVHTQSIKKMPLWFEFIFNTPSHHRVHHAKNPRYLDSNFAGILIIWDRIFKTFAEEDLSEPVDYGVVTPIESYNPAVVAFKEMYNIFRDCFQPNIKFHQRLAYIFAAPGYSHDGSRKSSKDLKTEFMRSKQLESKVSN